MRQGWIAVNFQVKMEVELLIRCARFALSKEYRFIFDLEISVFCVWYSWDELVLFLRCRVFTGMWNMKRVWMCPEINYLMNKYWGCGRKPTPKKLDKFYAYLLCIKKHGKVWGMAWKSTKIARITILKIRWESCHELEKSRIPLLKLSGQLLSDVAKFRVFIYWDLWKFWDSSPILSLYQDIEKYGNTFTGTWCVLSFYTVTFNETFKDTRFHIYLIPLWGLWKNSKQVPSSTLENILSSFLWLSWLGQTFFRFFFFPIALGAEIMLNLPFA